MYAMNDNSQAVESRNKVKDALLTLMKQYPYKDITITQICQEAQIVRQTYYRNFDSKDDILEFYLDNMVQQYSDIYYNSEDVNTQLKNFFEYMLAHREFLCLASENNLFFMINKAITKNIEKFLNMKQLATVSKPRFEIYIKGFIASTLCSLLSLWVKNEFIESPEMISELAQKFLSGLQSKSNKH
jgi:AcrR family transcriptional regulator